MAGRSGNPTGDRGPGGAEPGRPSGGEKGSSTSPGSSSGAPRGSYVSGTYYGGNYYPGGNYGGYNRYYYRGSGPKGATFGFFFGGRPSGRAQAWWPYYAVAVAPAYYDPYYQYPSPAPPYVIEVPPPEATTASPQGPEIIEVPPEGSAKFPIGPKAAATMPPTQCYAPKTDDRGTMLQEDGNMLPDFSKPVPCPPQ